jgi:hypothetical protein
MPAKENSGRRRSQPSVTIQHESSLNGIEYSFPADELGYGLKVNRDYVILALLVGGTPATASWRSRLSRSGRENRS